MEVAKELFFCIIFCANLGEKDYQKNVGRDQLLIGWR